MKRLEIQNVSLNILFQDFEELKKELKPTPEREMFISKPCSIGLYMSLLFTRGYGFSNHTQQIVAAEKIDGHPIGRTIIRLCKENSSNGDVHDMLLSRIKMILRTMKMTKRLIYM